MTQTTLDLIKHTAAIHVNSVLTLNQRKIANVLLHNSYSQILEDKTHSIRLRKILEILGWSNDSEVTNLIKLDLKTLNKFQLEWNIFNKDKKNIWGVTTLLSDISIENGYVYYTYSKSLREMLFNPNIYAKLDLIIQKNLKNKHALVLWEYLLEILCSSQVNEIITDYIKIEDLRKLLGVLANSSYENYAVFRAQALLPALDEINNKSDITVTFAPKREARKVSHICFNVKRKIPITLINNNIRKLTNSDTTNCPSTYKESSQEVTFDSWINEHATHLELSLSRITKDINKYGEARVRKAIQITNTDFTKGKKIKSLPAYYTAALKEEWSPAFDSEELKKTIGSRQTTVELENMMSTEVGLTLGFKKRLLENYGVVIFESWFRDLTLGQVNQNTVIVKASSEFKANWIISHYERDIFNILRDLDSEIQRIKIKFD